MIFKKNIKQASFLAVTALFNNQRNEMKIDHADDQGNRVHRLYLW